MRRKSRRGSKERKSAPERKREKEREREREKERESERLSFLFMKSNYYAVVERKEKIFTQFLFPFFKQFSFLFKF